MQITTNYRGEPMRCVDPECVLWLADNKCPSCVHRKCCDGGYRAAPLKGDRGWRCYGYRSRYWDMVVPERKGVG